MTRIVWLHEDCLSPQHPGLVQHADAPPLFVFDEVALRDDAISLKRIVFQYECLLETPAIIRRGDPVEEVLAFAREHSATRVVTSSTPSPRLRRQMAALQKSIEVEVLDPEPFVDYRGRLDLKRFSRYWQRVQQYAFGR